MPTNECALYSDVALGTAADRGDFIVENPGLGIDSICAQQDQTLLHLGAWCHSSPRRSCRRRSLCALPGPPAGRGFGFGIPRRTCQSRILSLTASLQFLTQRFVGLQKAGNLLHQPVALFPQLIITVPQHAVHISAVFKLSTQSLNLGRYIVRNRRARLKTQVLDFSSLRDCVRFDRGDVSLYTGCFG